MKILAIGNSFSTDATRYLHQIARSQGDSWQVTNLYISGCPLERHFRNMLSDASAYELQHNGFATGFKVSLKEALLSRSWDIVTLQQASTYSAHYHTYQPYLQELAAYVRKLCPKAKLYIHQTWGYEDGSEKLAKQGFASFADMQKAVEEAYAQAAKDIGADGLIPGGRTMLALSERIGQVHRDSYHATLGAGRLALGLTWYKTLSGKEITPFTPDPDEPISQDALEAIFALMDQKVGGA